MDQTKQIRDISPLSLLRSAGPGEILARLSRSGDENKIGLFLKAR